MCLTLSFSDTHGIAKYAHTYTRRYTHTHREKKVERVQKTQGGHDVWTAVRKP